MQGGLALAGTGAPLILSMFCNSNAPRLQVNTVLDSRKAWWAKQDSFLFNIFILICTPVQTTRCPRTFQFAFFILSCTLPRISASVLIGATTCSLMLEDKEGIYSFSILSRAPGLSVQLPPWEPFKCPTGTYLALTLFNSKSIFPRHPPPLSPPQRWLLYPPDCLSQRPGIFLDSSFSLIPNILS